MRCRRQPSLPFESFPCDGAGCAAFGAVAWRSPACDAAPVVGIIDTGVNLEHPALVGQSVEVLTIRHESRRAASKDHGTAVAALLVGRDGSMTPGLLPRARLIAVDAFHRDGSGNDAADAFSLARALDALLERDVEVIT